MVLKKQPAEGSPKMDYFHESGGAAQDGVVTSEEVAGRPSRGRRRTADGDLPYKTSDARAPARRRTAANKK